MTRLNIVLLIMLLASSIYLVRVSYDARRLFAEIHKAELEAGRSSIDAEREKFDEIDALIVTLEEASR